MSHVDALDFKGNGFQGCHTQNAMDDAVVEAYPRYGTDILPRLKGKVGIITNDANGQLVEMSPLVRVCNADAPE